ncbi:DUF4390 domain-containing protein [Propionivibrio limicola]|uniref:DUF4390 domain-containing protein n=1 Tax=Propionivibrio limicola TaxID=167645 RepID=UPI001290A7C0|nr:DUF4390 domain-containing protein [Propionivibrio limicola]
MRCWARPIKTFAGRLFLLLAVTLLVTLPARMAQASDLAARDPQLVATDDGYALNAEFSINFNARLEEAVSKGIVLYFVTDFELTRSRWYWLDEKVVQRSRTLQLSYHALTRQYRLSTGTLHQSFATLGEALRVLSRLRDWPVLDKGEVRNGQAYLAGVRMRLDLSQMPRTFQIGALANKDWRLTSEWANWTFTPSESGPPADPGEGK